MKSIPAFVLITAWLGVAFGAEPPRMPLLMPDDFSELNLVAWRVEPGTLDPNNPLIEGEMPWDAGGVGIHGSVFKDPLDDRWKAYLVCTPPEEQPDNPSQPWASENHANRRVCLFESDDGVHWTRPALANVPLGEQATTNIIFDVTDGVSAYSSVLVDPANREWPYEMFVLRESWGAVRGRAPEGNGYYRYRSRDGRSWQAVGGRVAGPMTGDLCFFYRQPDEGYVAYYRLGAPSRPTDHLPPYEDFARRSCYRAVSRDGNTWIKDPAMILTSDERDHRDTQYQECVPLAVDGGYLALVTMYHPLTQTLDLRMAASRDGRRWWFPDRRPCLANPPLGDYGGGMIWQSQNLIVEDDALHLYFGGTEGPHRQISDTRAPSLPVGHQETVIDHGAHFLPFNSALCRASWRFDRMYALISSAGGPTLGTAVTAPRRLAGRTLWVNLATRPAKKSKTPALDEGSIRVELLDARARPLPGFTRDDCVPLRGDHRALQVQWSGGEQAPQEAVHARFYLKRAFLYGFDFRDGPDDTAEPRPAIELRPYVWQGPYTEMRSRYATPHDAGLCVDVRAPWMADGERLILRTSEIVGYESGYLYDDHFPTQEQPGRGQGYEHTSFRWSTENAPRELAAECSIPGKGRFRLKLTAQDDFVDVGLSVRNDLSRPMEYVDWYFCTVAYESPTLADPALGRTYVFDGQRLRSLAELNGEGKGEIMYQVAGRQGSDGFIPPLHASYPRGAVQPTAAVVLVEDVFGTHTAALGFERAHSIFSSTGNMCFHADPYFGKDLKPGEERHVRGRLYLMNGTAQEAFERFQADTP